MTKEDPIDKGMKILARKNPESFLNLIFGSNYDYSLKVIEDPVLNIPEKRGDFIYVLQKGIEEFGLHLDFQLIPRGEFLQRIFLYNALFTEKLGMPVCSVVIYPEKGDYATFPQEYRVDVRKELWNSFTFKAIKLWEYRDKIESGELLVLSPLLVLLEETPDKRTLEKEKELINKVEDEKLRSDLFSVAITIASRRFSRDFLYKFFKEEMNMLKEWDIVQEWIKEGENKGIQQGMQQGIQQGSKEGVMTTRIMIVELLEDKLEVDKEIVDILDKIEDMKLLELIFRKVLKAKSLDVVKKFAQKFISETK